MTPGKHAVLAVDASTSEYLLAMHIPARNLFEALCFSHEQLKGENLLFVLHQLMQKHRLQWRDFAYLLTTSGPGSLTGLRIVFSTLKTLAQVTGIPLVTVPTLYALQLGVPTWQNCCGVFLNARHKFYYFREPGWSPERFELLPQSCALEKAREPGKAILEKRCLLAKELPSEKCVLQSIDVFSWIQQGERHFCRAEFQDPLYVVPFYGGKSVAEQVFEEKGSTRMDVL
ncbi:MAG TPA: hypothetical protein P5560_04600 [Thermotogota bacterium]|nr:hypothetical protein [Thermotogota bacterium]HRW92214.1 hypothetical protein [Thermotogota bacterium]